MSPPWSASRLGALFGYMHEDPDIECSLLPLRGRVLCVLSAGDMAFELLRAGASQVVAADPNRAQHELVRRKLQNAAAGRHEDLTGSIDRRLRWLARCIAPLVFPRSMQQAEPEYLNAHFGSYRWRISWSLLAMGIAVAFPGSFRRYLPRDIVTRLRQRFEAACLEQSNRVSPWFLRMLSRSPADAPEVWNSTWPDAEMFNDERLTLVLSALQQVCSFGRFDLVAASNILDTAPASELQGLLDKLAPQVNEGGYFVLRSLFRETGEWPPPPSGWEVETKLTAQLLGQDRSPLCRISVVLRRTARVATDLGLSARS